MLIATTGHGDLTGLLLEYTLQKKKSLSTVTARTGRPALISKVSDDTMIYTAGVSGSFPTC